jgi:hypothetical protein
MSEHEDYGDSDRNEEANVAARWWAAHLRNPDEVSHDVGDLEANVMLSVVREADSRNDEFDLALVDSFEDDLACRIQEKIENRPTWDYQQPYVGNTIVKCDYHADPLLQAAANEVGLEISSMTTFPAKTTMWIDPGHVRVRAGYTDGIETIWECGEYLVAIENRVAEWDEWPVENREMGNSHNYEPRVFPTDSGYLIHAYGHYGSDMYGPKHREFHIATDMIETDGIESVLEQTLSEIEEWRRETAKS